MSNLIVGLHGQEVLADDRSAMQRVVGQYITIHTDLPITPELEELPRAFDEAVPQLCAYFQLPIAAWANWRVSGCIMQNPERFRQAGLLPSDLPDFPHGFQRGDWLWLYDQPSDYYRRHLLLHEGVHAFMQRAFQHTGPAWLREGIAEMLATHQIDGDHFRLNYIPRRRDEVPEWGRVKVLREHVARGQIPTLPEVFATENRAFQGIDAYAWTWAAATFLDRHPASGPLFRQRLKRLPAERESLTENLSKDLASIWPDLVDDWGIYICDMDYGYDLARAAIRSARPIAADGARQRIEVDAAAGWQRTGVRFERDHTYRLVARGRFQVDDDLRPWISEPQGVTIRYHGGRPLGVLIGAIIEDLGTKPRWRQLQEVSAVGAEFRWRAQKSGELYLRINEHASGLADNQGVVEVTVEPGG